MESRGEGRQGVEGVGAEGLVLVGDERRLRVGAEELAFVSADGRLRAEEVGAVSAERTRPSNRTLKRNYANFDPEPHPLDTQIQRPRVHTKRVREPVSQGSKDPFQVQLCDQEVKIVDVRASFDTSSIQLDLAEEQRKIEKGCRCVRTKCLKQYCACFRNDVRCSADCCCKDCANDGYHEEERMKAVKITRLNDPSAFKGTTLQLHEIEVQAVDGTRKTVKGCRCTRSKCLKKYCECFGAGLKCSVNCVCEDCRNMPGSSGPPKPPKSGQTSVPSKSSAKKGTKVAPAAVQVKTLTDQALRKSVSAPATQATKPKPKKPKTSKPKVKAEQRVQQSEVVQHGGYHHAGAHEQADAANNDYMYPEVPDTPETVDKNEDASTEQWMPVPSKGVEDFYNGIMYDPSYMQNDYPQHVVATPTHGYHRSQGHPQSMARQQRQGCEADDLAVQCWGDEEGEVMNQAEWGPTVPRASHQSSERTVWGSGGRGHASHYLKHRPPAAYGSRTPGMMGLEEYYTVQQMPWPEPPAARSADHLFMNGTLSRQSSEEISYELFRSLGAAD